MEGLNESHNRLEDLVLQTKLETSNGISELCVNKVMTDEQIELLRQQISVYVTICEQLVQMHKIVTSQQDLSGMGLSNIYYDPIMASIGSKMTARQRWNPTSLQLQILEQIFNEGNGSPSKQKIKEITEELAQHGQISETNVYNWFQNRRARSKRKQLVPAENNVELEVEAEIKPLKEKMTDPENTISCEKSASKAENFYFQAVEISTEMLCFDPPLDKEEPLFSSDYDIFQQFGSYEYFAKS